MTIKQFKAILDQMSNISCGNVATHVNKKGQIVLTANGRRFTIMSFLAEVETLCENLGFRLILRSEEEATIHSTNY